MTELSEKTDRYEENEEEGIFWTENNDNHAIIALVLIVAWVICSLIILLGGCQ